MNVFMPNRVYREFLRFALEYARPDRRQIWKEVIGLLFGRFEEDQVTITDVFLPPSDKYSTFVKVGDYSFISDLMVKKLENDEYIIGWIHSHPGFGLFLSNTDVETQRLYETMDARAVAIVIDPTLILRGGGQDGSGMNAFKLDMAGSYHDVPLYIQNIADFRSEYQILASEIAARYLEEIPDIYAVDMSPRPAVDMDSISFNLLAPETVGNGEHFRVKLKCEVLEPSHGKIALDFHLVLKNAVSTTRRWKNYRASFVPRRGGTVVLLTLVAEARSGESAMVKFEGLKAVSGSRKVMVGDFMRIVRIL